MPDLKFKNLTFNTAAGGSGSDDSGDNDGSDDNGGSGGETVMTDIAAGFEKIKNNPHYDDQKLSRTLYQVD